tara:strand:+ start:841 stop:1038 length:198 start_codon:yes stop_codon:yes gene_type:complete
MNKKTIKKIIVEINKNTNWIGYGTIEILRDGPNSFTSFKTHQENPIEYAKKRKEYISGEYELIIK